MSFAIITDTSANVPLDLVRAENIQVLAIECDMSGVEKKQCLKLLIMKKPSLKTSVLKDGLITKRNFREAEDFRYGFYRF